MIGNWVNYFTFLLIVIIGLFFYNSYLMVVILAVTLFLPILSYIAFKINYKKIKIYIDNIPYSVGRNNEIQFDICVDNKSWYPFGNIVAKIDIENGFYKNDKEYQVSLSNSIKKIRQVKWSFESNYAGNISVCVSEIEIQDAMFLFKKEIKTNDEHIVRVFSEGNELKFDNMTFMDMQAGEEEADYVKGTDVTEISNVREYNQGDTLQSIHWKLTARKNEYMVKEYAMPLSSNVRLFVDIYYNKELPEQLDEIIEAFLAVGQSLIKLNKKFDAIWYDKKNTQMCVKQVCTNEDLTNILYEIFFCSPSVEVRENYNEYKKMFSEGESCIFITGESSEKEIIGSVIAKYGNKAVLISI